MDYRLGVSELPFTQNSVVRVEESSAVIEAAKKVTPAVVSITGVSQQLTFFGGTTESKSSGTGFIVQSDGLIVTNKHVISDTSTKFTVYTSDGRYFDASIQAIDPVFDIAILKIEGKDFPVVELGSSDALQPGQTAIAIGNALGQYQNSVTVGVVSAVGRVIQAGDATGTRTENLDNVIQTDAAINPGNSGGPLVNIAGQVIGVNTAVDQTGQSIGFAIPVDLVKSALDSYQKKSKIVRPMLGVRYISLNKDLAVSNSLPTNDGALLYSSGNSPSVVPGGPADKAGLKDKDIITKIEDNKITQGNTLVSLITKYSVDDIVKITYLRNGKEATATAVLVESK
jgi:serine protease Do